MWGSYEMRIERDLQRVLAQEDLFDLDDVRLRRSQSLVARKTPWSPPT